MILTQLEEFRQAIYDCLGKAKDAVFELMDAVLTSPSIQSFVSLSQSPVFRRQWPSIYAALHDSRPQKRKLLNLLIEEVKTEAQPFLAGDHTFWPRPDAKTLKERTFHGERGVGVGIGQSYSTLAWIPEADGSWALPLRHERITSFETPTSRAAFQLKLVSRQLEKRPLAAYDRGYGNAKFVQATEKIDADLLLRLASNRCVWGTPGTYKGRGAPCKHGHKFKLNDPQTWPVATETLLC
ncbi:transposase [Nostoc sp. XA013]|nr:transposase [Nostoc sp. XA013]